MPRFNIFPRILLGSFLVLLMASSCFFFVEAGTRCGEIGETCDDKSRCIRPLKGDGQLDIFNAGKCVKCDDTTAPCSNSTKSGKECCDGYACLDSGCQKFLRTNY